MSVASPKRFAGYLERTKEWLEHPDRHTAKPAPLHPAEPADEPTLADDAFHWPHYAGHSHPLWYVEWWYFAFEDAQTGLSGIVALGVMNPQNVGGLGVASMFVAVVDRNTGKTTTKMDIIDLKEFVASYTKADLSFGRSTNVALNEDHYHLNVVSNDGELALDLHFRRTPGVAPHWMAKDIAGTKRDWEVSSWMAFMPSASTEGTLRIGQQNIQLKGTGYHDHNWAVWLFPASTWQWAMFNRPDPDPKRSIAFDFATQESFDFSQAFLRWNGMDLKFEHVECRPGQWKSWHVLWRYPTAASLSATTTGPDDKTYRLDLSWQTTAAAPLWKCPMIIFEQTANFTGTLSVEDASGTVQRHALSFEGFYEYTAKWY
ncbi:MAG: hypothetical protein OXU20_24105 [Myxococcales bacterium]|nr:hypothetical protein [Myxococcales bacterium]